MHARTWVAVALIVGCKSSGKPSEPKQGSGAALEATVPVPRVDVASVIAVDDGSGPPPVVVVDDAGAAHLTFAKSWRALATADLMTGARTASLDAMFKRLREAEVLGYAPEEVLARWKRDDASGGEELVPRGETPGGEDPPPPDEEDRPDDDASGGTGTAMVLGETDEERRQREAAEAERRAEAKLRARMGSRGRLDHDALPITPIDDVGNPTRLARTAGEVMRDGKLPPHPALILASPRGRASKLVDAVAALGGAIAVVHAGAVRPLRLDFRRDPQPVDSWGTIGLGDKLAWLEARVSATGITIEAPPAAVHELPWASGPLDGARLATALAEARAARALDPDVPVDVLVTAEVDVQRLVDVLVALDVAGARMIGLGHAPDAEQARRRGKPNPTVRIGHPNRLGELDKHELRRIASEHRPALLACYTAARASQPRLGGTVQVEFEIRPNGQVAKVEARGVDPAVAKCVAGVVAAMRFPNPADGATVRVLQPFTMRP